MLNEFLYISFVFFLLFFSAYFAVCETAFTACSKPKMFRIAKDGDKKAQIVLDLQKSTGLVISSILTCNTILNTLISVFAARICSSFFGSEFVIYFSFIIAILIVLFAEVLPKMLALANPEKLLIPAAYFLKYIFITLKPLNNIIGLIAQKFISLLTKTDKNIQDEYMASLEELKGAIDLHKSANSNDSKQEKEMLKSVLDLASIHVNQIMVHRKNVIMLHADDEINSLIEQIITCPYTRIPIWQGNHDNIVGVLHVKDFLKIMKKASYIDSIKIMDVALKPWFIPENKNLLDQLQSFKQKREHFSLVVDEYGGFMGIVTLEDIIEEIVGDISDEHDVDSFNGIKKHAEGIYIVDGSVNIRDLNREIDSNFKNDIASTIAGLVINSVRIIPEIGQVFILYGYKFEILKKHKNQLTSIKIYKLHPDTETKHEKF
ncbi:membrane protein [Alphaproteobacteria bacterium]|nr:membrane protein [Alphaproteobacteria bacterium]